MLFRSVSQSRYRLVVSWNIDSPEQGNLIARAADSIYAICFLSDANELLIGQAKGEIHVIDLSTNQEKKLLKVNDKGVFSISENKLKNKVYVLGGDGVLSVLDAKDYSLIARKKVSSMKLRSVFFDANTNKLFIGCGEGVVTVFDDDSMEQLYNNQISKIGFSINTLMDLSDEHVLCGGRDAHLHWIRKDDLSIVDAVPAHNYAIYNISFSPDKKLFATASRDKTLKIWDAESNQIVQRIERASDGHLNSVNTLLRTIRHSSVRVMTDQSISGEKIKQGCRF